MKKYAPYFASSLLFASSLTGASAALARAYVATARASSTLDQTITPMIGVASDYGLESGVKASWIMARPGFIPNLNNSVSFEASAFLSGLDDKTHMLLSPLLRWDFHIFPRWSLYGSGGAELDSRLTDDKESDERASKVNLAAQVGGIWHFNPNVSLRGEFDATHGGVRMGGMFRF